MNQMNEARIRKKGSSLVVVVVRSSELIFQRQAYQNAQNQRENKKGLKMHQTWWRHY